MKRLLAVAALLIVCIACFSQEKKIPNFSIRVKQDRLFTNVDAGPIDVDSDNSWAYKGKRTYYFTVYSSYWKDGHYLIRIGDSLEEALSTLDMFIEACDGRRGEVMSVTNKEGKVISTFIVTGRDFSSYNYFGYSGGKGNSIRFIPFKDEEYHGVHGAYKSSLKRLRKRLERTSRRYGIVE